MAIETISRLALVCDRCGEQATITSVDAAVLARHARDVLGWQAAVDGDDPGSDLCPACLEEVVR